MAFKRRVSRLAQSQTGRWFVGQTTGRSFQIVQPDAGRMATLVLILSTGFSIGALLILRGAASTDKCTLRHPWPAR